MISLVTICKCTMSLIQALMDHENYYFNISEANLSNQPKWQFEYSAKVHPLPPTVHLQQV